MTVPFETIIRRHCRPLEPIRTQSVPELATLSGIQAVLFDVYGTLLMSASGDVGTASASDRGNAFVEALKAVGFAIPIEGRHGAELLTETIRAHQAQARSNGVEFPEVDIIRVWQDALSQLCEDEPQVDSSPATDLRQLSLEFECRVNPVWPMPHVNECLRELRDRSLTLGIVSNAQFFTPELFKPLMGTDLDKLGFDPRLCFYSYRFGQAKPGDFLYEQASNELATRGIAAGQVVYVGNDMLNDIWPAARAGFRTALFAGDARSLRLRDGDERVSAVTPDLVLTDLGQLPSCIANE